ncbi:hypothetical protein NE236_25360 [Actinoallomurus purpureus]|uniref:hypothetical protein n=1 Tax=Actinoallomurus purpureus TaxID=478114 RepID=UPI002092F424|nr:hypothetical protein [Actinoallomurus purpureus]MCO6008310.1 hypothetical protein [Actinoallomurus purpureus]
MVAAAVGELVDVVDLQDRLSAIVDVRSRATAFRVLTAQDRAASGGEPDRIFGAP